MRTQKFLVYIFVFFFVIFAVIFPAQTQNPNLSDVTGPNPIEVIPVPPTEPTTPTNPTEPTTPTNPTEPTTPTNPTEPTTPTNPTEPTTPTNPTEPTTPTNPTTPNKPTNPTNPNNPNKPDDTNTNNPNKPDDTNTNNPNKPDDTNTNNPNKPDDTNTNNPNKPDDTNTNNPNKPDDTNTNNPNKPDDTNTNNPNKPDDTNTNNPNKPDDTNTNNPNKPDDTNTNNPNKPSDTDTNNPNKPSDTDTNNEVTQKSPDKIIKEIEQEMGTQLSEPVKPIDRVGYEVKVEQAPTTDVVQLQEEFQTTQIQNYTGMKFYGDIPTADEIQSRLSEIYQTTEKKAALIYISALEDELNSFVLTPQKNISSNNIFPKEQIIGNKGNNSPDLISAKEIDKATKVSIPVSRKELLETVNRFTEAVSNEFRVGDRDFLVDSKRLYDWLIAPLETQFIENSIDTLIFNMDAGLRSFPLSALYDGKQFLVEKYAIAIIPSFGLTDTSYEDVRKSSILAMGASRFFNQNPLPAVPIELTTITEKPWRGKTFINEEFTIENFITQNQNRNNKIIHLGTHAEFLPGTPDESYIQFYDRQLTMSELRLLSDKLGWTSSTNSPVDLLVLSACRTALGDDRAELGFAGLAVQAGVKSVLASLWYVSDVGTLGLMSEFYQEFSRIPVKAEALRQAQLAMLRGEVRVENNRILLPKGKSIDLPENLPNGSFSLSHPYYWSAFMLVGNWT